MYKQSLETGTQLVKFSLVGVLNTAIQYVVFLVLYRYAGVHYLAASFIGYCAGLLNSYLLNRSWTFHARGGKGSLEFVKFTLVNIVSVSVNVGSLAYLVSNVHLSPEFGQALAIVLSTAVNFTGNKLWTFR